MAGTLVRAGAAHVVLSTDSGLATTACRQPAAEAPVTFLWPVALLGLLVVPAAVLFYVVVQRRHRREAERFGAPPLVAGLVSARPGWRRHVPFGFALAALAALVVGVARPEEPSPCRRRRRRSCSRSTPHGRWLLTICVRTAWRRHARPREPSSSTYPRSTAWRWSPSRARLRSSCSPRSTEAAALALAELRLGSGTAIGDAIVRSLETVRPGFVGADPAAPPTAPGPDDPPATVLLLSDGAQTSGRVTPAQGATLRRGSGSP